VQPAEEIKKKSQGSRGKMPLEGRMVLVTRTSEGNAVEKEKLSGLGARVVELDAIKIAPPSSWSKLDGAIQKVKAYDWDVFTSANGVRLFFRRCAERLGEKFLAKWKEDKSNPRFACVGPSTKSALEELGFECSFEPKEFLTSSLGRELAVLIGNSKSTVLLARAERANSEIALKLRDSGARVEEVPVYRTIPLKSRSRMITEETLDRLTDITLTSPSAVEGLVNSVGAARIKRRQIRISCIGPVTAKAAMEKGLKVETVAKTHTIDGLLEAMVRDTSNFDSKKLVV
jgi:uroporphyrinogen-III synthase